jgi:sulfite reductase (NADPH) hemoprotein beta-component
MAALKHPQILLASALADGETLFLGAAGWERDHAKARVARDKDEASALEAFG